MFSHLKTLDFTMSTFLEQEGIQLCIFEGLKRFHKPKVFTISCLHTKHRVLELTQTAPKLELRRLYAPAFVRRGIDFYRQDQAFL